MNTDSIRTVVLDQVVLYAESRIDAELLPYIKRGEWQRVAYADELAQRHILRMFGKSATVEMTCPDTWWDHVKMVIRARWPKLFERLRIKMRTESASCGAVMAGLPPSTARHTVIPYMLPPTTKTSWTGGTLRDNEEPWQPGEESLEQYVRDIASERYCAHRQKVVEVVVHPRDFIAHCEASERLKYYDHVGDRQTIDTAIGRVRIVIDPSQTRGVVGIP